MGKVLIRDIRTLLTAPAGIDLAVVIVETTEPGLYGLGCATFTQRIQAVKTAVDEYLNPLLLNRDVSRINDTWYVMTNNSYWRNGPVLNNAISGVDMALWDINGKLANMPVYQLLGGKCREGVAVYRHANGRDEQEVEENVRRWIKEGYRYVRCQMGMYGGSGHKIHYTKNPPEGAYYDPAVYARSIPGLFEHLRNKLGDEIELLHDVHERLQPIDAINLAKRLEPYRLFFLEDPLSPENNEWFAILRNQCATPIAMGELFNNPSEWMGLITRRLIDYIRVHLSQIGGITAGRKLAELCEAFGVRTAWHGPGDVSPVGHAANLHLDLACHNFGIQEWSGFNEALEEVFPGCPQIRDGYAYVNDKPGLGVDINEKLALKYPCLNEIPKWTEARYPDGTIARP